MGLACRNLASKECTLGGAAAEHVHVPMAAVQLNRTAVHFSVAAVYLNVAEVQVDRAAVYLNVAQVQLNRAGIHFDVAAVQLQVAAVQLHVSQVGQAGGMLMRKMPRHTVYDVVTEPCGLVDPTSSQ